MHKKIIPSTLCALLISQSAHPMAQTAKVADMSVADLKQLIKDTVNSMLAFVDPYFILSQVDEAKAAGEKLKSDLDTRERQIIEIQNKIKQNEEDLRTKGSGMSMEAREKKNTEIIGLRAQGQSKLEALQVFMQQAQQELEMRFLKKIQETADEIAKDMGLVLVHGAGIVYGSKALNISDKVVARMNKKYADEKRASMKPTPSAKTSESTPATPKQ
jgi:Skp family chaperone for outer membrane proteins